MNRIAFLDRDGTIARTVPYCSRVEDFELLPGVPEAIKLLNNHGLKVIVVTNQSGVARGFFTEATLAAIHGKMHHELAKHGAHVDAVYYCPHHPDENCECRKPKPGLLLRASQSFDADFKQSYVVGDEPMDMIAGQAVGCRTIQVSSKRSLLDIARWITADIKTSIIVPAYNEEMGLAVVLSKLSNLVDESCEIIVVDDGSTDRTLAVAADHLILTVLVINRQKNQGKGAALTRGIADARGENIIWIDADDSYPAELIPQMIQALNETHDAVVCSRIYGRENIPTFNRVGAWIFRVMIRGIYGFTPFDPMSGLNGVRKSHLLKMKLSARRFAVEPEIAMKGARMHLKMLDLPIEYRVRVGCTKLNGIKVGFEDLFMIIRLLFWRPKQ